MTGLSVMRINEYQTKHEKNSTYPHTTKYLYKTKLNSKDREEFNSKA